MYDTFEGLVNNNCMHHPQKKGSIIVNVMIGYFAWKLKSTSITYAFGI